MTTHAPITHAKSGVYLTCLSAATPGRVETCGFFMADPAVREEDADGVFTAPGYQYSMNITSISVATIRSMSKASMTLPILRPNIPGLLPYA